jgi:hypothetical protein
MEVMNMSRIGKIGLALCVMLATPVLGHWEYDGTTQTIGGPGSGSGSDPYGTWSWSASAYGWVDPGVTSVTTSGQAYGNVWVNLYTYYQLGLQRSAYGTSRVEGTSSYHWVEDQTSKEITIEIHLTMDEGHLNYEGYALDYLWTSPATSSSQTYIQDGGSASGVASFYPYGYGYGVAYSGSGSNADNSSAGVEATYDYSDAGQANGDMGWYEGELVVSGSADFGPYPGTPPGLYFSATAALLGSAYVQGQIVINGQPYYGGFYAYADYYVNGTSTFALSGNIADLQ